MKFDQILNAKLEFKRHSGAYYKAEHDGHEIGFMTGDHPPDNLYYIYCNRQQIHEGKQLPAGWSVPED